MKFLVSLTIILSISFTVLPGRAMAGDGGQYSGVTNCFIDGRWVTVRGNCPAPSGGGTSSGGGSGAGGALYGGFYSLGYAFGQWLVGGGSDPQEEARRRAMMEELQRRQAEAERQQQEEEARRLAGIYNRLARTLKLSGIPELRLKGAPGGPSGLKLKTGDGAGGGGIAGLPGIYLDGGDKPYGVPGLPGIYTGGPGQGSELSASRLKLKIGEETAAAAPTANAAPVPAVQATPFHPADMTPQQLADIAEMFSRLPPEEQAHLMAMAQKDAAGGPPVPETAGATVPGLSGQLPANAPAPLRQQSVASQAAASAPTLEDASYRARAGFDHPPGSALPVRLDTNRTTPSIPPPPIDGLDADAIARGGLPYPPDRPAGPYPKNPGPQLPNPSREEQRVQAELKAWDDRAADVHPVVEGIYATAKRLGWEPDKLDRLNKALNDLTFIFDSTVTNPQLHRIWQEAKARSQDANLAREASRGEGPGFPGAGAQTRYNDCAIFALANAARLPYGVVAARAADLIRDAEWRSAEDRANPQKTMEKGGLNGGEVIMLAESFGRAEVVPPADLARTLRDGKQVLVNVRHRAGTREGHEVVLTKVFMHDGETWYEMMDSYQGPMQRLYLGDKELNAVILEKGVAFSPEPGSVPGLLRGDGTYHKN